MKTKSILSFAATLLIAVVSQAQQSPSPQPQQPPPAVQGPPCTPPEVYQHVHPESSKPLHKILGRLNDQINKATGGTVSGPTADDVRKTLPPPCPKASPAQPTVIK